MRLFLSFQIAHTQVSQITLKNEWEDLDIPAKRINCSKCAQIALGETEVIPSHCHTRFQMLPKMLHPRKRCLVVSEQPHPATHIILVY